MRSRWWRRCVVAALAAALGTGPAAHARDAAQRGERAASEQAAEAMRAARTAGRASHPAHLERLGADHAPARSVPAAHAHVWSGRGARREPATIVPRIPFSSSTGQSVAEYFDEYISGIVQAQCVACHVEGGASGNTRVVFEAGLAAAVRQRNRRTLADFLALVDDGGELLLNKVQGVSHGGGLQLRSDSAGFEHMRTWLGLVGEEILASTATVETLFDPVRMVSNERTLRRAALLFAGRNPTPAELGALADGSVSLNRTILNLMQGPAFRDFLLRAANDRLLTDKHIGYVLDPNNEYFVELVRLMRKGRIRYGDDFYGSRWYRAVQFGVARAPLELIAHVVENNRPYTEVLTADYVMANPFAAEIYGADTEFEDDNDPFEFRPSEIAAYYGKHDSKITRFNQRYGLHIISRGDLKLDIPHAGILNTHSFLQRYPSTATNRNRARARWTYYHFLGLDVEKSASRTTDPVALADTDNPTMHNGACTVCHAVLDPVAGAFQNYGDEGFFRENYGGLDSLDEFYKEPPDGSESLYVEGDTWYRDMRPPGFDGRSAPHADASLRWLAAEIAAGERFAEATVRFWWPAVMGAEVAEAPEDEADPGFEGRLLAANAQAQEVSRLAGRLRNGIRGSRPYNVRRLLVDLVLSDWFRAGTVTDDDPVRREALRHAGAERLLTPEELSRKTAAITGVEWGRVRPDPARGFAHRRSNLEREFRVLYGGIDSDGVTRRAGEMTALMATVAQRHAVELARMIALRELYLLPSRDRRLLRGVDVLRSPAAGISAVSPVRGLHDAPETLAFAGALTSGTKAVSLTFMNGHWDPRERRGRHLRVDRLDLRDSAGDLVRSLELEALTDFSQSRGGECADFHDDAYAFHGCAGTTLQFPLEIPADGEYRLELVLWAERYGDELPRIALAVQGDDGIAPSAARRIKARLAALHWDLLGERVSRTSADVEEAYGLFVDVWEQGRANVQTRLCGWPTGRCPLHIDQGFFEGIVEDQPLAGNADGWRWIDWRRAEEIVGGTPDPFHVGQAWATVLAFLMTDYRYLHL